MITKILSNNLLAVVILALAILISAALFAGSVGAASVFDIEFPVAELGNCADKAACKTYCAEPTNESVCQAFAAKYDLDDSQEEVDDKFKVIETDGGPGNCAANSDNPRASCEKYCSQSANMRECVAYAKKNNLMPSKELEEAEKVIKALDSGVKLPAACTDMESCKATCDEPKDVATARSCFDFAEQAGLLPPEVDREKAEKMFKAMEDGRAPFKSPKEFEQCENPPSDEIFEKCVSFALETGMLPPAEAELIKKTGGKGPGGCRGKEQCETYCENNQEVCFQFAEEHGLVSEADRARMKEGTEQFRSSLEQAPPEVATCLKETVGSEVLDQLQAGTKPPSRELGEKMRQCFENFFQNQMPGDGRFGGEGRDGDFGSRPDGGGGSPGLPEQVRECLIDKLGVEGLESLQKTPGEPMQSEHREVIENCFRETSDNQVGPGSRRESGPGLGFPPAEFRDGQPQMMEGGRVPIEGEIKDRIYDDEYHRQYDERMREFQERSGDFPMPPTEGGATYPYPVPSDGSQGSYPIPPASGADFIPPTDPTQNFVRPPGDTYLPPSDGVPPGTEFIPPPTTDVAPPPASEPATIEAVQSRIFESKPETLLANIFSAFLSFFGSGQAGR